MGRLTRLLSRAAGLLSGKGATPYAGSVGMFPGGNPFTDVFGRDAAPGALRLVRENLGTAYACASLNGDLVAKTRLRLFVKTRRGEGKGRLSKRGDTRPLSRKAMEHLGKNAGHHISDAVDVEEVKAHPLLDLLDRPNDVNQDGVGMGRFTLMEITQVYQEVVGRAYWYVEKNGVNGTPSAVWVLAPQYVTEWPGGQADGPLIDRYEFASGANNTYDPSEVVAFRMPDPATGGYTGGLSPLRACFEEVKLGRLAVGLTTAQVQNGGKPSAVWNPANNPNTPGAPIGDDAADRMRTAFRKAFAMAGAGGVMVSEFPGAIQPLQWAANDIIDAARIELGVGMICHAFGVPDTKFKRNSSSRASAQSGDYSHCVDAGLPRLRRNESAINCFLVPMYGSAAADRLFVAYDDPPGMEDTEQAQEKLKTAIGAGALLRNELRADLNLEPVGGFDTPLVSNALVPCLPDGKPDPAYSRGGKPPAGPDGPPSEGADATAKAVLEMASAVKSLAEAVGPRRRKREAGKSRRPFAGSRKGGEDEPRDDRGRWTEGGGSGDGATTEAAAGGGKVDEFAGDPKRQAARDFAADVNARVEKIESQAKDAAKQIPRDANAEFDRLQTSHRDSEEGRAAAGVIGRIDAAMDASTSGDAGHFMSEADAKQAVTDAVAAAPAHLREGLEAHREDLEMHARYGGLESDHPETLYASGDASAAAKYALDRAPAEVREAFDADDLGDRVYEARVSNEEKFKPDDVSDDLDEWSSDRKNEALAAAREAVPAEHQPYVEAHAGGVDQSFDEKGRIDADKVFAEDDGGRAAIPHATAARYVDAVNSDYGGRLQAHEDAARQVAAKASETYGAALADHERQAAAIDETEASAPDRIAVAAEAEFARLQESHGEGTEIGRETAEVIGRMEAWNQENLRPGTQSAGAAYAAEMGQRAAAADEILARSPDHLREQLSPLKDSIRDGLGNVPERPEELWAEADGRAAAAHALSGEDEELRGHIDREALSIELADDGDAHSVTSEGVSDWAESRRDKLGEFDETEAAEKAVGDAVKALPKGVRQSVEEAQGDNFRDSLANYADIDPKEWVESDPDYFGPTEDQRQELAEDAVKAARKGVKGTAGKRLRDEEDDLVNRLTEEGALPHDYFDEPYKPAGCSAR